MLPPGERAIAIGEGRAVIGGDDGAGKFRRGKADIEVGGGLALTVDNGLGGAFGRVRGQGGDLRRARLLPSLQFLMETSSVPLIVRI